MTSQRNVTAPNSPNDCRRPRSVSLGGEYNDDERRELTNVALSLRRLKRQLLLRQVQDPESPVDCFRDLILHITAPDHVPSTKSDGVFIRHDRAGSISSIQTEGSSDSFRSPRGSFSTPSA